MKANEKETEETEVNEKNQEMRKMKMKQNQKIVRNNLVLRKILND